MQGQTPLMEAVNKGKLDVVELLASKGADVKSRDNKVGGKVSFLD